MAALGAGASLECGALSPLWPYGGLAPFPIATDLLAPRKLRLVAAGQSADNRGAPARQPRWGGVAAHSMEKLVKRDMSHLLEVNNLQTHFPTRGGLVKAVDGVTFHLDAGELLGLVGESGCGKSITALSIMRLIASPGKIVGGELTFDGKNLLKLSDAEMRQIRGDDIAMIFQDPMTSLNPVFTVGEQIAEALRLHRKLSRKEARAAAIEAMREVSIPDPARRINDYPHQLSGGMRQRVMIAMALACDPKLLIADEPTTALDVTIQAQILELLEELRQHRELAVLLITHDLGVVAEVADRVAVMYTGRIVEESSVEELFARPKHPYTEGLLRSVPKLTAADVVKKERLETIEGTVPSPTDLPPGCHFAPRCPHRMPRCTEEDIPLYELEGGVRVRCVLYDLAAAVTADHKTTSADYADSADSA